MATIGGVHHVAIKARDVERVAQFYREVLGLAEERRHQDDAGALRSIWLRAGSTLLMIERSSTPDAARVSDFHADPPGLHLVALAIAAADRATFAARLSVVHQTKYTLYVLDPEGNRVGLSSYPDPDRITGCKDGQDGLGDQSADPSCPSLYPVQNPDPDLGPEHP